MPTSREPNMPSFEDCQAQRPTGARASGAVHDQHVWTLTSRLVALSAHAVARFGIQHTTIQLEGEPLAACCGELSSSSLTPALR